MKATKQSAVSAVARVQGAHIGTRRPPPSDATPAEASGSIGPLV